MKYQVLNGQADGRRTHMKLSLPDSQSGTLTNYATSLFIYYGSAGRNRT